jgi:hypothetical protein
MPTTFYSVLAQLQGHARESVALSDSYEIHCPPAHTTPPL